LKKFLILFFLLTTQFVFAQTNTKHDHVIDSLAIPFKNNVYGTFGTPLLGASATINYERILPWRIKKFNVSFFLKVGYGGLLFLTAQGPFYLAGAGILVGKGQKYFELVGGGSAFLDLVDHRVNISNASYFGEPIPSAMDDTSFQPYAAIGYRHYSSNGRFVFRTGISFREAAYVSYGFTF
jgi:hypothetical protein